jgi:hypothetical protein
LPFAADGREDLVHGLHFTIGKNSVQVR